jgi:hypothetical protein
MSLDFLMQVKSTSPRTIGVDPDTGGFVVFDQTVEGVVRGHVRTRDELTGAMQSVLRKAGLVDRRGNILWGAVANHREAFHQVLARGNTDEIAEALVGLVLSDPD